MASYPRTISLNGGYELMTLHSAEHEALYRARIAPPSDEGEDMDSEQPAPEKRNPPNRRTRRKAPTGE